MKFRASHRNVDRARLKTPPAALVLTFLVKMDSRRDSASPAPRSSVSSSTSSSRLVINITARRARSRAGSFKACDSSRRARVPSLLAKSGAGGEERCLPTHRIRRDSLCAALETQPSRRADIGLYDYFGGAWGAGRRGSRFVGRAPGISRSHSGIFSISGSSAAIAA